MIATGLEIVIKEGLCGEDQSRGQIKFTYLESWIRVAGPFYRQHRHRKSTHG